MNKDGKVCRSRRRISTRATPVAAAEGKADATQDAGKAPLMGKEDEQPEEGGTEPKPKPEGGKDPKPDGPKDPKKGGGEGEQDKVLQSAVANAMKLNVRYLQVQSRCRNLAKEIKGDPSWARFNNAENRGMLETKFAALETQVQSGDLNMIVLQEGKDLKASLALLSLCNRFIAMNDDITEMEEFHNGIMRMKRAAK